MTATAVFAEDENPQPEMCSLTVAKEGEGETSPPVGKHRYEVGSSVALKAEAADDWHFVAWVVGQDSLRVPDTAIVLTGDLTATAVFAENLSNGNLTSCQFMMYPNPARQEFMITSDLSIKEVEVFDATGRLVFKQEDVNADRLKVDVSVWSDGVYLVHVVDMAGKSAVRRMIVSR